MSPTFRYLLTLSCLLAGIFTTTISVAQNNIIKGTVVDTAEKKQLQYAIVALIDLTDTTLYRSIRSYGDGSFEFSKVKPGKYTVMVSYPRMADYVKDISVGDTSTVNLGKVIMITQATLLQEVVVTAGIPIRMKGDTLEYTADSFAVKPGANVEELLKRLPGMYVERNGKIYAQGQEVKKILVDGDEFFSDDPGLASKYLRADAIDKVQVFDAKSEQAQFSGVDDGARTKTINLKLKKNKRNGMFAKASVGGDGQNYYRHEGMLARFNASQKISVFGYVSKVNNDGFNYQDMSKYVNQDYEMIDDGAGNVYYTSNNESDDYWGGGLPLMKYGGVHYSDKWNNNKHKLFTNYRIKSTDVTDWNNSNGTTVLADGSMFRNTSAVSSASHDFYQKAGGSIFTTLDTFTTLKVSVNGRAGNGNNSSLSNSSSANFKGVFVNNNSNINRSEFDNKRFASNVTLQHKFRKEGRTLSVSLQQEYSKGVNDNYAISNTNYYDTVSGAFLRKDSLNQLQQSTNPFQSYAGKATYTEKFSKKLSMSVEYGLKKTMTSNVFNTFNNVDGKYEARVDSVSNDYDFGTLTHITGGMLNWNNKKFNISVGSKVYISELEQENNDLKSRTTRSFVNWAPSVNVSKRLKNGSINVSYSGETGQPQVDQLQPLRRTSNNLYISIGNPDLRPEFRHRLNLSFNNYNNSKQAYIYGGISANYTQNDITNQTTIDAYNRTVNQFINMNGIPGAYAYFNYSRNYQKLHLRPSIYTTFNSWGNYSLQNGKKFRNQTVSNNTRLSLTHDWKDKISTSYTANLTVSMGYSNATGSKNSTTFSHTHTLSNGFYLPLKFEIKSDCNFTFQPRNSSFNTNFNNIIWNASVQKKFMKNDQLIVSGSVNDILNKNTGYNRSVYGSNVYENNRFVIKRYFMLTATWNFTSNF